MQISPIDSVSTSAAASFGVAPMRSGQTPAEQAKTAASQFEAILIRQFLQESVGSMMGGSDSGTGGSVYGYLLTDVLSEKLASSGGLGLSKVIEQQLTPRGSIAAATAPDASPADATSTDILK